MAFPSINKLMTIANVDRDMAKRIRLLVEDLRAKDTKQPYKVLKAIDVLIGAHGVEYMGHKKDTSVICYGFDYINMGDSYLSTLIFNYKTGTYQVTSVGELVERDSRYE